MKVFYGYITEAMCNVYSLGLSESCHQASVSCDSLRELNSLGITEGMKETTQHGLASFYRKRHSKQGSCKFLCSSHLRYFKFLHLIVNLEFFMQHHKKHMHQMSMRSSTCFIFFLFLQLTSFSNQKQIHSKQMLS